MYAHLAFGSIRHFLLSFLRTSIAASFELRTTKAWPRRIIMRTLNNLCAKRHIKHESHKDLKPWSRHFMKLYFNTLYKNSHTCEAYCWMMSTLSAYILCIIGFSLCYVSALFSLFQRLLEFVMMLLLFVRYEAAIFICCCN